MNKFLFVLAAIVTVVSLLFAGTAMAKVEHCDGHSSPSNVKVEGDYSTLVLPAGVTFCVKGSTGNSGTVVSDGITPIGNYLPINNGGNVPAVSYYVVYQPIDPTQPPVDPTEPPVDPTQPPVDPTEPPIDPTQPPVDPTEPPIDPTQPPVDPTEPPIDPTQPAVVTDPAPTDPPVVDRPSYGETYNCEFPPKDKDPYQWRLDHNCGYDETPAPGGSIWAQFWSWLTSFFG